MHTLINTSQDPHVGLIEQVNLTGCMVRSVTRHNHRVMGQDGGSEVLTLQHQVLKYGVGRYCHHDQWPGIKRGPQKNCYQNATRLVESDPLRFIYCEGYGNRPDLGIVAGEHAWVLDKEHDYEVIDVTWRKTIGVAYIGIPFRYDYLSEQLRDHRVYGLLDTPWSRWPVRRLPASDWLHPDAALMPRDFTVPDDLPDPTIELERFRQERENG
jgi:hypothetical protein